MLLGGAILLNGHLIALFTYNNILLSHPLKLSKLLVRMCKDGLNIRHALTAFVRVTLPVPLLMDNQGDMHKARNLVANERSKHEDLRYHVTRDFISS